jgi:hypothetical protein
MFGILRSFRDFFLKSYSFLAAVAVLAMSGMAGLVMAEAAEVEVSTPEIDWGTVAGDLVGALTGVAVVGLGIAISLWVLFLVARVFKRSAT